ncbi:cytochrome P450 [Fomes fomentarius]|nr:cytochrome P450 [Fomes fomentarius]
MLLLISLSVLCVSFILFKVFAGRLVSSLARIAGPKKEHWLTGNLHRLFKDGWDYNFKLFAKYGGVIKVYGMLGSEQLLVSDPRALHHIVVKEQNVYHETDMFVMTNRLIFGEGLISTLGEQHRKQRKMLNPNFSLANMRLLLPEVQPITDILLERLRSQVPEDGLREIDLLPWIAGGTLQYVSKAVLGISLDTMGPRGTNEYADAIRDISPIALKVLFLRPFVPMIVSNFSPYWRNKLVDWLPFRGLKELRDISSILERSARNIIAEKQADLVREAGKPTGKLRRDLMTIMLEANMSTLENDRLSEDEFIGQINTLLFGGQETTTSAVSRILHLLACMPNAQVKLRTEIRAAKLEYAANHGVQDHDWQSVSLPYDVLNSLPYLDAIVRETLRVYPPTSMLNRTCTQDAVLPLQFPVRSATGEELTAIHVPAGTNILVSILGSNHNKGVWGEDASVWRPERWLTASGERVGLGKDIDLALGSENAENEVEGTPGNRNGVKYPGVYATMMTFLGGGRACVAFKFAEMEIKQVVSTLVSVLHFAPPSAVNTDGVRKEIHWRMDGLQIPVVRAPHGDGKTSQVPLDIRLATEGDFM